MFLFPFDEDEAPSSDHHHLVSRQLPLPVIGASIFQSPNSNQLLPMMEVQGQDGSKAVVIEPGSSETVFGRGRGLNTQDRTVSRNHVLLRVNRPNPNATVSFEVVGRNPVWVSSGRGGEVRVYRSSEKGEVEVGDRFCVSGRKPVWFVLKGSAEEVAVGGGGEVGIQSESESEVDERFEMDVSGIDPVKGWFFPSFSLYVFPWTAALCAKRKMSIG